MNESLNLLVVAVGFTLCAFLGFLGFLIIWKIASGDIDLSKLISDPNGDASISRLQLLIFTFVVAFSLFWVTLSTKQFPAVPGTILSLLGISATSYLVSKGIQFSNEAGVEERPPQVTIQPANPTLRAPQSQQFSAETVRTKSKAVKWSVVAGPGTIDATTGLYTAAAPPPTGPASTPQYATIKAESVDDAGIFDLAVITLV
ncbi:MAG: hypothetical protein OSA97_01055 [Nevskia sp.]|nr:hypothetical protein [Nevskia sp.]